MFLISFLLCSSTSADNSRILVSQISTLLTSQCRVQLNQTFHATHAIQTRTLLVKCNQALGNSLSDSVGLGHATSTLHTQSNIHVRETLLSEQQDWLHHLPAQGVWLKQFQRSSVQSDLALTTLHVGHGHGGFLHIGTKNTNQYLTISSFGLYIEAHMTKAPQIADAASAAAFSNPFTVVTYTHLTTECLHRLHIIQRKNNVR